MYYATLSIPGKQNTELSYVFTDELPEQENGSILLFGIFDVLSSSEVYHTIIKESVKHFLDFYHGAAPAAPLDDNELPDPREFLFENSIQYTYEKVSDALRELQDTSAYRHGVDLKKINCVLGALMDDMLYLSITGTTIVPLLVYPVIHRNGPRHFMLINIADNAGNGSGDSHARLFSQIISGAVSMPSSCLMLCNETFLDFITTQQIKQTIASSNIETVIPSFQHLLSRVHARNDFSAILIARNETGAVNPRRSASTASSLSMTDLNATASSTRMLMAPTFGPQFRRIGVAIVKGIISLVTACVRAGKRLYQYATSPTQLNRYKTWRRGGIAFMVRFFSRIPRDKTALISAVSRTSDYARHAWFTWFTHARGRAISLRSWFFSLNVLSRSLFVLSLLFLLLFLISLVSIQVKNSLRGREARLREILVAVEQKQLAADASLIYDDRARARALLAESSTLLDLVDERLRTHEAFIAMKRTIESLQLKIDNVVIIDEPSVLATLPAPLNTSLQNTYLFSEGTSIGIVSGDSLYHYDRTQKTLGELPLREKIPSISCSLALSEKELYLCSGDATRIHVVTFPDKTIQTLTFPRQGTGIPSRILFYNNRLYAFYRQSGTLVRHQKSPAGFNAGQPWLRESTEPLADARDVAIDGLVYILSRDGGLKIFRSGRSTSSIVPDSTAQALRSASRIITAPQLEYLYALNPTTKRIIIINKKTLSMVGAITSPSFVQLNDIAVSKEKKTILALDQNRLMSIPYDVK